MSAIRRGPDDEEGSALWVGWPALALVTLALLLTVDLAAYLVATERARGAADAAALAAVAASDPRARASDPHAASSGSPRTIAARVARGMGAELRACDCAQGRTEVEVSVAVDVRAIAVTRFAGGEVEASARAHLVPESRESGVSRRRPGGRRYPPVRNLSRSVSLVHPGRGRRHGGTMTPEDTPGAGGSGHHDEGAGSGFAMDDPVTDDRSGPVGFLLDAVRRRRFGRHALSAVIALLFLGGAGMFSYPFFTDLYTNQYVQSRLAVEFDDLSIEGFDDWEASLEPGRALTKIVIPDLEVETLVVHGTSPDALRAGAGHYPNTPLPGQDGNVGIAGHRTTYGKPFNRVDELNPGDRIWLITPVGDYEYEVSQDPWVTGPRDWSVVEPTTAPSLTLTTCHPKGSAAERLIVRAELVGSHPPGTYGSQPA